MLRSGKEQELVNELKGRVESAYTVIEHLHRTLDESRAMELSKEMLGSFRFGDSNYI